MSVVIDGTSGITTPAETVQGALTTTGNTILGDASTDTLNVGNGGLVKDASGNVGIGTASPTKKLQVVSNTAQDGILISGSTNPRLQVIDTTNSVTLEMISGDSIATIRTDTNHDLSFGTNGTERMRIDSSGNVTLQKNISVGGAAPSASGSGITFPATQSASSDANTLDDYEEGTWTPTITFSGGNGNLAYATRVGTYTKIGRSVTFTAQLIFGETTAVGYLDNISGLPITSAFRSGGGVYIDNFSSLSGGAQWALTSDTSSSFVVYVSGTGAATAILASSVPASSAAITVSGTYFV